MAEIAPVALRYGATSYQVFRFHDDRYKFLQTATFEHKLDWERYWGGQEFIDFRVIHSSWFQVPVLYQWTRPRRHRARSQRPSPPPAAEPPGLALRRSSLRDCERSMSIRRRASDWRISARPASG